MPSRAPVLARFGGTARAVRVALLLIVLALLALSLAALPGEPAAGVFGLASGLAGLADLTRARPGRALLWVFLGSSILLYLAGSGPSSLLAAISGILYLVAGAPGFGARRLARPLLVGAALGAYATLYSWVLTTRAAEGRFLAGKAYIALTAPGSEALIHVIGSLIAAVLAWGVLAPGRSTPRVSSMAGWLRRRPLLPVILVIGLILLLGVLGSWRHLVGPIK